ncbi:MAG: rod shape-determining protein [Clostridia bacterium]|nr:rod shape-determining protein [Clostridia bacterium]
MYTNEIVIDMGFSETVIAVRGKGVVLKEPTLVAAIRSKGKHKFIAAGIEAKRYMRRRDRDLNATLIHPVKGGVIEDVNAAIWMLKDFLHKAMPRRLFRPRPEVIATIACGTSVVERKNYENVLAAVGLKSPILMEAPIAVSGLLENEYNLIATVGASVSDVAIVGPNGIITGCSVTMCGNAVDEKIRNYIADNYRLGISHTSAEELRKKIGTYHKGQIMSDEVSGRNLVDETHYQTEITSNEIAPMMQSVMSSFAYVIESVTMMCPEKHCMDVYHAGITLCGGYAFSEGLSDFLFERLRIAVNVPKNADEAIALGALSFFDDRDKMYKML